MRPIADLLQGELTDEELELVPRSYDVIGSEEKAVAVIDIPEELKNKKKLIAEALMKLNKNVKSVLNKVSGRKGTYRLEELELIAGEKDTEVVHKEHGYLLKLDPQKVFFSPREATERQRIASQVKSGENVLVMFSGVAPYAICIAKKRPEVNKVYCIEINPGAHRYAQENVRINKLAHKIVLINGDVKNLNFDVKFDRIVMPMAIGAEKYLDNAFKMANKKGVIHFYTIGNEKSLFSEAEKLVMSIGKKSNKSVKAVEKRKVLPYGNKMWKIVMDVNFK